MCSGRCGHASGAYTYAETKHLYISIKIVLTFKKNSYAYISFPFQKFIIAVMTSKLGILWELMASRC